MARVTVEDCVDKVPNRFDLVLLAAQRAREISGGAELTIDRDRDKNPVVALREIAETTVKPEDPAREPGPVAAARAARRGGRGGRDRLAEPVGRGDAPVGRGPGALDLGRRRLRRLIAIHEITREAVPRGRGLFVLARGPALR